MKTRLSLVLGVGPLLLPRPADAANIYVLSFDESGNINQYKNGQAPTHPAHDFVTDPLQAGNVDDGLPKGVKVLQYTLPDNVRTGSWLIPEQTADPSPGGPNSDFLYFQGNFLYVYSNATEDEKLMADVGIPTTKPTL